MSSPRQRHIYSPFFVDDKNGISYTYNEQDGLHSTNQSRSVLRSRSVIAAAFMRGNVNFFEHEGHLFYGERYIIGREKASMISHIPDLQKITGSSTAEHVGYFLLPADENAGWAAHAGWAVAFLDRGWTAEHMMHYLYNVLRSPILYLLKNEAIYNNIVVARTGIIQRSTGK